MLEISYHNNYLYTLLENFRTNKNTHTNYSIEIGISILISQGKETTNHTIRLSN